MDKQLIDNAHEIWAAAQLLPGEGIEDGANRIAAILERLASEVCRAQNAESERQDGLSLTGATQKEAQEPVGCLHRDYTGAYYVEPTRPDIARHLGKELFTTPQPPAPCPKCRQFQDEAERLTVEAAEIEAERDALQAKVAELEAEAAENCRIIGMSGEVEARHLARIADLEKVAQAYEDQVAAHNKTLNELARKVELIDEQKGTIRALNMALGGDGSTSTENLIDANEFDAGDKGLIALCREHAALIEKCEKAIIDALKTTYSDKLASDFRNVLAAIAAQKGGAA